MTKQMAALLLLLANRDRMVKLNAIESQTLNSTDALRTTQISTRMLKVTGTPLKDSIATVLAMVVRHMEHLTSKTLPGHHAELCPSMSASPNVPSSMAATRSL